MCMCDLRVQSTHGYKNLAVHVQYVNTILVTKFAPRALNAVPRLRIKSVYLKSIEYTLSLTHI